VSSQCRVSQHYKKQSMPAPLITATQTAGSVYPPHCHCSLAHSN